MFLKGEGKMSKHYPRNGKKWEGLYGSRKHFLSDQQREVIELRYGLKDGIPKTAEEVAQILGVPSQIIDEIMEEAFHRMKSIRIYEKRPKDWPEDEF